MALGTIEIKGENVIKKFVPMFPHLYLKEDVDKNPNSISPYNMGKIECNFFDKNLKNNNNMEPEK